MTPMPPKLKNALVSSRSMLLLLVMKMPPRKSSTKHFLSKTSDTLSSTSPSKPGLPDSRNEAQSNLETSSATCNPLPEQVLKTIGSPESSVVSVCTVSPHSQGTSSGTLS